MVRNGSLRSAFLLLASTIAIFIVVGELWLDGTKNIIKIQSFTQSTNKKLQYGETVTDNVSRKESPSFRAYDLSQFVDTLLSSKNHNTCRSKLSGHLDVDLSINDWASVERRNPVCLKFLYHTYITLVRLKSDFIRQ